MDKSKAMKKPKKKDFKYNKDPDFSYTYAMLVYELYIQSKSNPFLKKRV